MHKQIGKTQFRVYTPLVMILILSAFLSCGIRGAAILDDLAWSRYSAIKRVDNGLQFSFARETLSEDRVLTQSTVNNYHGTIHLTRMSDPGQPVSIYLAFLDDGNYYRLNIYPESGKFLIYRKQAGKLITLYNEIPGSFKTGSDGTPVTINLNNKNLTVTCSETQIFTDKILWTGRFGFSAMGKAGDEIIISLSE